MEEFDVLHGVIFSDEMTRNGLTGPGGQYYDGDCIWRAADCQVWERADAGEVPAGFVDGAEEVLHCYYGAGCGERCGEFDDCCEEERVWGFLCCQWDEEVVSLGIVKVGMELLTFVW